MTSEGESRLRAFFGVDEPHKDHSREAGSHITAADDRFESLELGQRTIEDYYFVYQAKVASLEREIQKLADRQDVAIKGMVCIMLATLLVTALSLLRITGVI